MILLGTTRSRFGRLTRFGAVCATGRHVCLCLNYLTMLSSAHGVERWNGCNDPIKEE